MWKPVSAPIRGYLSLLGLKNTGRNPGVLLDDVRPSTEMTPWYLEGAAQVVRGDQVFATAQLGAFYTLAVVPEGQLWWIHSLGGDVTGPAAPTVWDVRHFGAVAVFTSPTAILAGPQVSEVDASPPNTLLALQATALRGFFAPAGTELGLQAAYINLANAGGVAINTRGYCRFTPMIA